MKKKIKMTVVMLMVLCMCFTLIAFAEEAEMIITETQSVTEETMVAVDEEETAIAEQETEETTVSEEQNETTEAVQETESETATQQTEEDKNVPADQETEFADVVQTTEESNVTVVQTEENDAGIEQVEESTTEVHEHTQLVIPASEPTCTESGHTEEIICETCGEILVKGEEIAPLGHDYVNGICSRCQELEEDCILQEDYWEVPETYYIDPLMSGTSSSTTYNFTFTYGQTAARSMLSMVNEFRIGEDAWYWSSDDSTKVVCSGLSELTYDYELEKIAMKRAAEVAIAFSHTRPNGTMCNTSCSEFGYSYSTYGENIAAGYSSASAVFTGWQETDETYSGQGHRRNMLSSSFNRIGIGHVYFNGRHYWVQEFAKSSSAYSETTANDSDTDVDIEILDSNVSSISVTSSPESIEINEAETCSLPEVTVKMNVTNHWGSAFYANTDPEWSSADTSIVSVSDDGVLKGESAGTTTITATVYGNDVEATVTVSHVEVTDAAVEATCTKTGLTEGSHCSVCGEVIKAQEEIPAKGHTIVTDAAVEATCTETGLTEGSHCSVCGEVIKAQEVVPAKGHTEVTDAAVEATCTETGLTEGSHCSVCGEVIKAQEEVPAKGHSYSSKVTKEATCTEVGVKTYTCSACGDSYTEEIPAKGHTIVTDAAEEATCTETGLTEGSHCSVCGEVIKAQEEVPAKGHSYESEVTKEASCTEKGVKTYTCSVCGDTYTEDIPVVDHTYTEEITEEATCTEKGVKTYTCSVCGDSYTEEIPAKGHTYTEKITKEATVTEAGEKTYTCSVCGDTYTEEIPAIGIPDVKYRTHVQTYGWQDWVENGSMAGTSGESKRLEMIQIQLDGQKFEGSIRYRTHVQTYGWLDWVADGTGSGTSGEAKRLEAIQIELTDEMAEQYDVYYRVHAQHYGWLGWAKNGEMAGTSGFSYRLEAIEIVLVESGGAAPGSTAGAYYSNTSGVQYRTHVQTYGWQDWKANGVMSGTSGESKRLEMIQIQLTNQNYSGGVQYRTHVQTYGWMDWVADGAKSGTEGEAKRLEAIQIQLTGAMANHYDIYYRVHAQHFGWMGWAVNGQQAGTAGYAYRLEGIEIRLVPKGGAAPGSTSNCFIQK